MKDPPVKKIYTELGLEYLKPKRSFRQLRCFYKIKTSSFPHYLTELLQDCQYNTQLSNNIATSYQFQIFLLFICYQRMKSVRFKYSEVYLQYLQKIFVKENLSFFTQFIMLLIF